MTAIILVGVAAALALFVAVAATRPSAYHVERKLEVAAPTDRVFGVLDDLRQFAGVLVFFGSPLELDPSLHKTFDGPAAGVGQSFAWSGRKVGKATLTIEDSIPGHKVGMKLELSAPMKSTATYVLTVAATSTGSVVTWSTHGNHNFIGKAFGMFMNMDRMRGSDLEKGLAQVNIVASAATTLRAEIPDVSTT
jgi:hypothetical protein